MLAAPIKRAAIASATTPLDRAMPPTHAPGSPRTHPATIAAPAIEISRITVPYATSRVRPALIMTP